MKDLLITSSVLIIVLLILRAVFANKVRRTLIYGTWLLVALRLLLPFQIGQLSISVLNLFQPVTQAMTDISHKPVIEAEPVAPTQAMPEEQPNQPDLPAQPDLPEIPEQTPITPDIQLPDNDPVPEPDMPQQEVPAPEVQPPVQEQVQTPEEKNPITVGQIAWSVWAVGSVLVAIWLSFSNLHFVRRMKKTATAVSADSPIPVYVTENAVSPCLVGLFRPAVYLTPEVAKDEQLRRYVMTHELTHYAHKDHIWSTVRCLCLCLYWFDPLVWVAAWCSRRDCELACDEGAMARLGEEDRIAYGKALLTVVQEASVPSRLMLTATTMAETKRQLRRRVNFIARKPHLSLFAAIALVLVCILVVGCVATGAKPQTVAEDPIIENPAITEPTEATTPTETVSPTETTVPTETVVPTDSTTAPATEPTKQTLLGSTPTKAPITVVTSGATTAPAAKPTEKPTPPAATGSGTPGTTAAPTQTTAPTVTTDPTAQTAAPTEPAKPAADPLTVSEKQLKEDFLTFMQPSLGSNHACTTDDVNILFCSRTKAGCVLIIGCKCTSNTPNVSWDNLQRITISELDFYMPGDWYFLLWADGKFQDTAGYDMPPDDTWLTYMKMRTVWQAYCSQFPAAYESWKQNNPGLTEPPAKSFLYKVNADGKTCSITGTGYYDEPDVVIPETLDGYTVTAIESLRDPNISSLVMPDTVTAISSQAFIFNTGVRSITFSKNLISIGSEAFKRCENLEAAILPDSLNQISYSVFADCTSLSRAVLPKGMTAIPGGMFSKCSALTDVVIPETVTSIGGSAFGGCSKLSVTLPQKVTAIGSSAFTGCILPKNFTLPNTLTQIGGGAFSGCSQLTQLVIPDSVKSIDTRAFGFCQSLTQVTIGKGATDISMFAFESCPNLSRITISPANTAYSGNGTCIVETATSTLIYAAKNCVIPADGTVTAIGDYAFSDRQELESIVIPEGVLHIRGFVFQNCTALKEVSLPLSLKSISIAFNKCSALNTVRYNGTLAQWRAVSKATALGSYSITVQCIDGKTSR